MDKKIRVIFICIFLAAVLILTAIPTKLAEKSLSYDEEKIYTGPKTVFDDKDNSGGYLNEGKGSNGGKGKPPSPPTVDKWAVIVGIADYQGTGNDLLYPDDDAVDMYNYLILKGYPSSNIKLLTNRKASANNIVSAIDWMNTQETKTTSECVFFYSGHGTTYNGYNDGDTEYTDEAIVSYNLYIILDGQLRQKFSTFTSQKIVFIFDSCFSGGMNDLIGAYTSITYDGRVVDAACAEDQLSWDGDTTMKNGVFTYYYMQGLSTYNNAEDAHAYATPLAHNAVTSMYGEEMDSIEFDTYTNKWQF
jgi:hypothetical protein